MTDDEFPRINKLGNEGYRRYRAMYDGNWPVTGPGWLQCDAYRDEVLRAALDDEMKRKLDRRDPDAQADWREFIVGLMAGAPGERVVDPDVVPGRVAGCGATDWAGYQAHLAHQAGDGE